MKEVLIAKEEWLKVAKKTKKPIPLPRYQPVIYKIAS